MGLPQFVAEASLGAPEHRYRTTRRASGSATHLVPQYNPYSICQDVCVDCLISGPLSYLCRECDDCIRQVMMS